MRKPMVAALSMAALALGGIAVSPAASAQDPECQTIVEIAAGNEDFSTLVTAVTEAGLVDTLNGDGPFTVFAPTNDAFDALPEGTLEALLADPEGALTDILLLHVIDGAVDSEAAIAAAGTNVETLGGPVAVALEGETLTVGGAPVIDTDIEACNGIVHVLGAVITEPAAAETPAPAPEQEPEEEMPMPTAVNTGDSGLAASANVAVLPIALLAGLAVLGLGSSSYALARARRQD
ncbi:MAG: fasciclin domain-containing protein [Acidimicrobiales bacterium]